MQFDQVKRREFITPLGGAAVWPLAARAQQTGRTYRLAIAHPTSSIERLTKARPRRFPAATIDELRRRGYAGADGVIE